MLTGACMLLVGAALLLRIAPSAGQAFRIPGQRPTGSEVVDEPAIDLRPTSFSARTLLNVPPRPSGVRQGEFRCQRLVDLGRLDDRCWLGVPLWPCPLAYRMACSFEFTPNFSRTR
jgi:hypothetical protein